MARRILTSASLRATSIMLPITMSESNVFQASLKYPCTEQAGADDCEHRAQNATQTVWGHIRGPTVPVVTRCEGEKGGDSTVCWWEETRAVVCTCAHGRGCTRTHAHAHTMQAQGPEQHLAVYLPPRAAFGNPAPAPESPP